MLKNHLEEGIYQHERFVSGQYFRGWFAACENLISQVGNKVWMVNLVSDHPRKGISDRVSSADYRVQEIVGLLRGFKKAVDSGTVDIQSYILNKAVGDFFTQAQHLYDQGFHVAACVLARGVLESHLRNTCVKHSCMPTRNNPTINDFNQSLYQNRVIDNAKMQLVQSAAAVGNSAAHHQNTTQPEARMMLQNVSSLIAIIS